MSPTDPTPTEALAREVERVAREVAQAAQRVGEVEAAHDQKLDHLADTVNGMAEAVDRLLRIRTAAPQSWFLVSDVEVARALLADLVEWLNSVYLRFKGSKLPDCWSRHPEVVEELWALRCSWAEATSGAGWGTRLVQWHNIYRPAVVDRIRSKFGTCDLPSHVSGGQTPIAAPGAAHLDAIADHWVAHGVPPEPTELELQQAREYSNLLLDLPSA